MAIIPHPSSKNLERYRVYDSVLGVQKYFSIKKLGKEKALDLARDLEKKNEESKRVKSLINEFAINKLFTEDGKIRGLSRIYREYKDGSRNGTEFLSYQFSIKGKGQVHFEVHLNNRTFENAYSLMKKKIIDLHEAQLSRELADKFRLAKRFYWNSVKPSGVNAADDARIECRSYCCESIFTIK